MKSYELPTPAFFSKVKAEIVQRVEYLGIASDAEKWATKNSIEAAAKDKFKIALMIIDAQNTFCLPEFELFVGGQSGRGAIEDNIRLAEFIYRNLRVITKIFPTMDTHTTMQIFHPVMWVDAKDMTTHPTPGLPLLCEEICGVLDKEGKVVKDPKWVVNPAVCHDLSGGNYKALVSYAKHYAKVLSDNGRYDLLIWPYHGMLGGIGHALVCIIEEALFFHNMCRHSQTGFEIKGGNPLTENYSIFQPEVLTDHTGAPIASKNARFFSKLLNFDAVIIAGQAKSHCVAWTIDDLLREILAKDAELAKKVYLMDDCTSSVVIPGVIDFTKQGDDAFEKFAKAGMHVVKSTTPVDQWPGINL